MGDDCDDDDPETYPGAPEICDGKDNDCDSTIPDVETDGDGDEWLICAGDCDDENPEMSPGHPEVPDNGLDDDCDGDVDEPFSIIHVPADRPTIQAGIDAAFDGDIVTVASGTYVETIDFHGKAIRLQSGEGADGTVIDGNELGSVVTFSDGESADAIIDGFTIQNGMGPYFEESPGYWRHCGGGIFCSSSSPTITNCTISGNTAGYDGGGLFGFYLSSPTVMQCEISDNLAGNNGGGVACFQSSPTISNCTISDNTAGNNGGGFGCEHSSPALMHCTMSGNSADYMGGGLYTYESSLTITNCILWGDSAHSQGPEIYLSSGSAVVTYSDVQGGWSGEGNINTHPLFAGLGDFHLTLSSPCIDSGTDAGVHTDMDSDVRPLGAGFDMGADEYPECWDRDFDGFGDIVCGGYDCDDTEADVNPGTEEICDNGIDDDCDGLADWPDPDCCGDADGDGFTDEDCGGYDCDDGDTAVFPGADEICDGKDTDCDGIIPDDEVDGDGDGWILCADCDDTDLDVNPGADEICHNEIDDDCDGLIDYPDDPDCEFTLELEGSYETSLLSLDFTLGTQEPVIWSTSLILTYPTNQRIPLWAVPLPIIDPPIDIPIAFPLPHWRLIWITTGLYTGAGTQAFTYEMVDTGHDIQTQSNLPDTGIEFCYDHVELIYCPSPEEPFYGQDAQYSTNPMSFRDHGDGTVTDNVTGLIWQQEDDDVERDWYEAIYYCWALELADHTDWRLPDEYELQGIADYGRLSPAIDTTYFPGTSTSKYWSVTPFAEYAWQVDFGDGEISLDQKYNQSGHVRCARGESTEQSFTDNGDGTVTDNVTGLMWQQEADDWCSSLWENSLSYCENLELAGYADWRLPDIKELRSIVDNTKYNPAIDTTYFGHILTFMPLFWSSSNRTDTDYAWTVNFEGGGVDYSIKKNSRYVRCVR